MSNNSDVPVQPQVLAGLARGRCTYYSLLNLPFISLPDADFIQQMRLPEMWEAFEALATDPESHPDFAGGWAKMRGFLVETETLPVEELVQLMGLDRTRLYRGVSSAFGPPPPYEAVWAQGVVEEVKVLGSLKGLYHEAGLAPREDLNDREDYIGLEMDYLGQMAGREAEAWDKEDIAAAVEIVQKEARFARSMSAWVSRFVARAEEYAQTGYYRGHMQMVKGYLADEVDRLEDLLAEAKITWLTAP